MRTLGVMLMMAAGLALSFAPAQAEAKKEKKRPLLERVNAAPAKKANGKAKAKKAAAATASANLSRDIVFDGASVNGKYHSAGEAVAKVETEKKLNDLIGMRRDFKDRLMAERERLKRGEAVGQ
jgi:hypothetical protein